MFVFCFLAARGCLQHIRFTKRFAAFCGVVRGATRGDVRVLLLFLRVAACSTFVLLNAALFILGWLVAPRAVMFVFCFLAARGCLQHVRFTKRSAVHCGVARGATRGDVRVLFSGCAWLSAAHSFY